MAPLWVTSRESSILLIWLDPLYKMADGNLPHIPPPRERRGRLPPTNTMQELICFSMQKGRLSIDDAIKQDHILFHNQKLCKTAHIVL